MRRTLTALLLLATSLLAVPAPAIATQNTTSVEIGPYENWRWAYPEICVENHSSFPMQIGVGEWSKANDLILWYENCDGWGYSERIDVYESDRPDIDACFYTYQLFDDHNKVYRMIKYLNTGQPGCWSNSVRRNHWVSNAIGTALGLEIFWTYPPTYVSVMRQQSQDTVSYAQPGDRTTFDWYNNLTCPPTCEA